MSNKKSVLGIINDIDYAYIPEEFLKEFRDRIGYDKPMRKCIYLEPNLDDTKYLLAMKYNEEAITRELILNTKDIPNPFASYHDYRLAEFKNKDNVNLCWLYRDALAGPMMKVDKEDDSEH